MINYNNIEACLILGSYMDTIGYHNGKYEFNFNTNAFNENEAYDVWIKIITDFASKDGFNNMNIKDLRSSDDTIMMIHTGYIMLNDIINTNTYIKQYILAYKDLLKKERGSGIRLTRSLEYYNRFGVKGYKDIYMYDGGGNGAAMKACVIGIRFHNNISELISHSIQSAKYTHNNPYGYLGSMAVALIICYALKKINPNIWIDNIIDIYNNNKIFNKIKSFIKKEEKNEFENFFVILEQFNNKYIKENNFKQNEIFNLIKKYEPAFKRNAEYSMYGQSGIGLIIAVMFCIMNSVVYINNKYIVNINKSLIFSSLCFGDSDTIGMIVGNIIGCLSGYEFIKHINFKDLEFYNEIKILSKKIYKNFLVKKY